MTEGALLRGAGGPVFSEHDAVVGGGTSEGDAVALIVSTHAGEGAAARHAAPEMIDVRGLKIGASGLIVAAILIQPRDWIGIGAAVGGRGLRV